MDAGNCPGIWEDKIGNGYIFASTRFDKGKNTHANADTTKVVFNATLGVDGSEGGIITELKGPGKPSLGK